MKKVGKFLVILLLLLAIAGGGLAYAYFYTDVFKSNKEMFFTYIMQNSEVIDLFDEPGIAQISEKQITKPQNVTSRIDVEYPKNKEIDDLNIVLTGKSDVPNNKYDYELNLNYNETVGMPYRIVCDGNNIAVTSKDVVSQFIGIKNENLKSLAEKFGINSESIPDKFEFEMPDLKQYYFDENDKSIINYNDLIKNNFMEENFSKAKSDDGNIVYTLTTTTNTVRDVSVGLLDAMKGESIIINKVLSILNDASNSEEKLTTQDINDYIDEIITDLKENDIESKEVKINVYVANKDLLKTEVISDELNLILIANENKLEYDIQTKIEDEDSRITFAIDKKRENNNLKYDIATKIFKDSIEMLNLDIDYAINGIDVQDKVIIDTTLNGKIIDITSEEYAEYTKVVKGLKMAESYNPDINYFAPVEKYTEEDLTNAKNKLLEVEMLSAGLKISTTSDFASEVVFEELDKQNMIALNDYDYDVIVNVFGQVATNFTKVHADKLKEAGLESDPYLVVPTMIIGTGMYIYNSSVSSINSAIENMGDINQVEEPSTNDYYQTIDNESGESL